MGLVHVDDDHRRRLLVDRHHLGAAGRLERSIGEAAAALALVHSTDPATPYLSMHARTDASVADVDAAFFDERTLLRHTTIRRTVFAMPLDVVPLAHGAVNRELVVKLRKHLVAWIDASPDTSDPAAAFLECAMDDVIDHLRSVGPSTGSALSDAVSRLRLTVDPLPGKSYSKPIRITSKVLEILAAEGRIARGRPTGNDFTSGAWTWALIDDWCGPAGIPTCEPGTALAGLVERYLAAFGPATVTDLAWWTGLAKGKIKAALADIEAVEVSLDDVAESGFIASDADGSTSGATGVVAMLPGLDSTTMGWKLRAWYVDDRSGIGIFDRNGNAGPTIWLDGRVVGVWTQRASGEIVTHLVDEIGSVEQDSVDRETARLTEWLGDVRVKWRFPTPLSKQLFGS